ncbi:MULTISPECIES: ABZJ_00895 family protein [unclassified Acinetobacter]|uniref:ABZJ_00895 family protein n=1 Tax=unclassified Acinetobacter TaxID=196816 RepID=UPI00293425F9|nr:MULTISPECIES: ABZJ_00895 family protein [unclassified Acinetobacter]WOE31402.1 ABZJ_00895 family protein [Acinetobacter sp. SAAs470]WOE39598.1 ABZJ_00895 family protein [Acinetobacter sp. SAAs474]
MTHYLKYFAAVYCLALLLVITVLIFGFQLGGISVIPALIAAAFIAARHFVRREQRLPFSDEKVQLVWGSSAVAIVIGSFFVFFLVLMNPRADAILASADQAGIAISAVIMLFIIAVHGAIFSIAYGWYAQFCYKRLLD